jgi:hypothetical protein
MPTLYIREYATLAAGVHDTAGPRTGASMPQEPGITDQAVPFSATAGVSAALDRTTLYVALIADAAFSYVVGPTPTVTAGVNLMVPANAMLFLGVQPYHKIAAVAAP